MSNMSSIIEIYRMTELKPVTRANVMIKLGRAINDEYSMNLTNDLVGELIATLDVSLSDLEHPGLLPTPTQRKDK